MGERIVTALGAILSIVNVTVPVVRFVAGSVTVTSGLFQIVLPVPTHCTLPPVEGVGLHVVQEIVTVSPDAILGQAIVTSTFPLVGFGVAVHNTALGAVASYITCNVFDGVFPLPA
jgi:hypothetical protein